MKKGMVVILLFFATISFGATQFYKMTTELPSGRQMYGTVIVNDFLYVIGGNMEPDIYTRAVEFAKIKPDGTLENWQNTTPLPKSRCYINNTTLTVNNVIYVIEGLNGETQEKEKTILWSTPMENGQLSEWQESPPCPSDGVSCAVAIATNQYIYLIGGSVGGGKSVSQVWGAKIGSKGEIIEWKPGPVLPFNLWFHCGGVVKDKVFIWGGLKSKDSNDINTDIYNAQILPTGELGPWNKCNSQLSPGFFSASGTVSGNYLISFFPRYAGAEISNDIWFTMVVNGEPTQWSKLPTDIQCKHFVAIASDKRKGIVYLPGGRLSKDSYKCDGTVYYFRLSSKEEPSTQVTNTSTSNINQIPTASSLNNIKASTAQVSNTPTPIPPLFPGFINLDMAKTKFNQKSLPVIIYFHAPSNKDCQSQQQILNLFNPTQYDDKIILTEINPYQIPEAATKYQVNKVPTWLFFDANGQTIERKESVIQLTELEQSIKKVIK